MVAIDLSTLNATTLGSLDGGTSTGNFNGPTDLTLTPDGGLLVLDTGNNRVVRITAPPAGGLPSATGWTTFAPQLIQGYFNRPTGIAFGSDGHMYVTDTKNHRLVRFDDMHGAGFAAFGIDGSGTGQFVHPSAIFVK